MRVFDAGMGDGSLLTQLMRHMHQAFPFIPWLVVAKEISIEDVRQALARLPDRFLEHPEMVFVVTNHHFRDAPSLPSPEGTVWREVALDGATTNDFTEQIEGLYGQLARTGRCGPARSPATLCTSIRPFWSSTGPTAGSSSSPSFPNRAVKADASMT